MAGKQDAVAWCFAGAFVLGLLGVLRLVTRSGESDDFSPRITRVDEAGGEAAAYLASFVFPFLTVSNPDWQDVVSYLLFGGIYLGVLVSTNLIAVNPLLFLFGYRIWRVESSDLQFGSAIVIGKHRPFIGEAYRMSGHRRIYFEHRQDENDEV
ncbi:hypothetical protein [Labedella endophytica]|uniref:Uncharacterized protein n=1 Tax=Labedella endophytica TaxID=1523160 RepID=A0A3S1CP00_9MICO|nr:hypothetical protein [Labedella endophytica]RUQ96902.1 hypothetical protein ELQ94_16775 [Labedella endophytica]